MEFLARTYGRILERTAGTLWQVIAILVLGAATFAEFTLYAHGTATSPYRVQWDALLPAHIVRDRHVWPLVMRCALVGLAGFQTFLLFIVSGRQSERMPKAVLVTSFGVAVLLSVAALQASYLTSNDAYSYIRFAKLASITQAYAPPRSSLAPPFDLINKQWDRPLPAPYGPLDLALYRVAVGPRQTIGSALLAVRFIGLASLLVLAALVYGLTRRLHLVTLVIANPGLYQQFVVNAHNDLIAVDLILGGVLLGRRIPIAGALLAAASGLVKITFLPIAPAFAPSRTRPAGRALALAGSIAIVGAGAALFGGRTYVRALATVAHHYTGFHASLRDLVELATHAGLALFGTIALALAAFDGATPWSLAWSFTGFAVAMYPNYFVWGLPYALREARSARAFFAILPIPSLTADFLFPWSRELTYLALVGIMTYEVARMLHARNAHALAAAPARA